MAKRDYYDILGVGKKATADEIRKAHRKLVLKYHPDRNRDNKQAEERFKEIQEAYDVLSDTDKRSRYDEFGHAGVGTAGPPGGDPFEGARRARAAGGRGGSTQWRPSPGVSVEDFDLNSGEFGSMFEQLFGAQAQPGGRAGRPGNPRPRRTEPQRGEDLEHPVTLSFEQAALGMTQSLQIDRGGSVENIEVKIPAGVKDGSRIRIKGKGGQGGGEPGDIFIIAHVLPHAYFRRENLDIYLDVPISLFEAVLGTKITVPTLEGGQLTVTIPPGTSSGAKLRLKGHGIERAGEKGDEYAVVKVMIPRDLDAEDKDAIAKAAEKHPMNPRAEIGW